MLNFDGIIEYKNYAEIDLGALRQNYALFADAVRRKSGGRDPKMICVVKADCYGHGAAHCVPALTDAGADFFAVSSIDEALEVRALAPDAKILILGYTPPKNAPLLARHDIIQCVHNTEYAEALEAALAKEATVGCDGGDGRAPVHIKLDTGMNRLGFPCGEANEASSAAAILAIARTMPHLDVCGAFTHFACADEPASPNTDRQIAAFDSMIARLTGAGLSLFVHASNSAAGLRYGDLGYDGVRAGIVLYGRDPSDEVRLPGLVPVMRLYSRVSEVHTVRAGEAVSYGATYVAARDVRVATISIGYADGLVRACGGGLVSINGCARPIVGRICMDQCMVALEDGDRVQAGDLVTIYGDEPEDLTNLARQAGTIPYELLCLVGHRVPRVYTEDGVKLYYSSRRLSDL